MIRELFEQAADLTPGELIVDNFAGGGGASLGIERAFGRAVDIAVNHDRAAVTMHTQNHPHTQHLCEDVWKVDPLEVTAGRAVGLAWFSPNCAHFSKAKGAKPVDKRIRGLAWIVIKWARAVRPRVIMLENVREFETWGPLTEDQRPCPKRKGRTFKRWVSMIRNLGYVVEWRSMNAADFGAPTHRRRLFLVARCDGEAIVWPDPTHGPGRALAWRTAAECIDWNLPCPSIFERKRPLAEKTLRRIAMGIKRYILDNPRPFVVKINHGGDHYRGQRMDRPLSTVTNHHGHALVSPTLVAGYGEAPGQEPRAGTVEAPLGTVVGDPKHALVGAFLAQHFGGVVGKPPDVPLPTITAIDHTGLSTATLVGVGGRAGQSPACAADEPLRTTTAKGDRAVASAMLVGVGGAEYAGKPRPVDAPKSTVLPGDRSAVCLARFNHGDKQWNGVDAPLGTVTSQGNKFGLVRAFLLKFYSSGGQGQKVDVPIHTIPATDRFGLVTIDGLDYAIADIGLRMLTPRELARAQGFPDSYVLTGSKAAQVSRIGNSVCPVMAEVLVRANLGMARRERSEVA